MGYETEFSGQLDFDRPLDPAHKQYLNDFFHSRRMMRCSDKASKLPDPVREAVKLPIGTNGCYYVGGADNDSSVLNYNSPPKNQPGLWCDMNIREYNGVASITFISGKFYDYIDWLKYVIKNFIELWGYKLNGEITWCGEDRDDMGKIIVSNNVVSIKRAKIDWEDD